MISSFLNALLITSSALWNQLHDVILSPALFNRFHNRSLEVKRAYPRSLRGGDSDIVRSIKPHLLHIDDLKSIKSCKSSEPATDLALTDVRINKDGSNFVLSANVSSPVAITGPLTGNMQLSKDTFLGSIDVADISEDICPVLNPPCPVQPSPASHFLQIRKEADAIIPGKYEAVIQVFAGEKMVSCLEAEFTLD
jgi:hypothetical protein